MPDAQTHFTMFGVVLLMSTFIALGGARIYERCELARDLLKLGVNKDDVATWVCIAFHESRFDTAARNPSSGDHGLLQISELYWCGPGKACGLPCSALRNDDISDDVRCALRIHEEHTRLQGNGFLAWVVYPQHCKHNAKKYIVDCDTSVKYSQSKFDDRSRYLKSLQNNVTNVRNVESYQNNNKVKPNYLAISDLFKGNYVDKFEEDYYNNKAPVSWINFKIDNIDKLKLPNLNRNNNFIFTTPSTTTTTMDPALVGIKPPMPRRIESNQFRRRMLNSVSVPPINKFKNDYVPRKTFFETSAPSKIYDEIDLSHNPFINLKNIASTTSTEAPYWLKGLTPSIPNYIKILSVLTARPNPTTARTLVKENSIPYLRYTTTPSTATAFASTPSATTITILSTTTPSTTILSTTTPPTTTPSTTILSTATPPTTTLSTTTLSTTTPSTTTLFSTTLSTKTPSTKTPVSVTSRRGKSRYVPDGNYYNYISTQNPSYTYSTQPSVTPNIKTIIGNKDIVISPKKQGTNKMEFSEATVQTITTKSDEFVKLAAETKEIVTEVKVRKDNFDSSISGSSSKVAKNYETTLKPPTTSAPIPRSSSTSWLSGYSWRNGHLTTSKPPTTLTTSNPTTLIIQTSTSRKILTSTSATPSITQNVTTSTESPSSKKTTFSIFDLYLNPTKATIRPFKFSPFENRAFKLSIFSGGTTPSSHLASQRQR